MDIEEAKELLKEMQENCKSKTIYKDEKAEAKAEAIEVVLKELDEIKAENDTIKSRIHIKIERAEHKLRNNISNFKRILLKDKVGTLKDVLFEEYYSSEKPHKYSLEHMREQNKTLRKDIETKREVINEMAEALQEEYHSYEPCKMADNIGCEGIKCIDCIKQYFYKKVEDSYE